MEAPVFRNVEWQEKKGILIIKIDLNAQGNPSSTGKTTILASTGGNKPLVIDGQALEVNGRRPYLGVNCFCYPPRDAK